MSGAFALVVPLFDEAGRFEEYGGQLVDWVRTRPAGSELVFVDDGSRDATASMVDALIAATPDVPVRLLRRPHEGKGAAVAAGLASTGTPHAGFCDADLATPLDQLERIVRVAMRGHTLAIGSRDLATSKLLQPEGRVREALGRTYNRLLQATITPGVVDTQCGAKVASREVWERILPHCSEMGFAWDAEVIAVAGALGIEVQEVPIEWRHDERSGVHLVRDGTAMVLATGRIWRTARRVRQEASAVPVTSTTGDLGAPPAPATSGAPSGEVFDDRNAGLLMAADREHWWFRSKAAFIATALRRTDPGDVGRGWLVDAGAGAGGVTALLGWAPERVAVLEGNAALVSQARRAHGLAGVQAEVGSLPVSDRSAEVVCLLDVIEHLVDPLPALHEAARILAPGGRLVVNVPAHTWLWSAADESLGHIRRYTRTTLRAQLAQAGLEPVLLSHVFSWLVLPVWVTRRMASGGDAELGLDRTSFVIDRAAMVLTALERALLGRVSTPLGTSVLCVARRR
ncbi:MAG: bifunctional glycosyltransferase/class I SAM-dependent methyltransferase [Actinomycetota bacterium]|nr:bifunctional glycosyltransferase/class I SAM-dependent methyltransferase [Actinomycetota bacterium]